MPTPVGLPVGAFRLLGNLFYSPCRLPLADSSRLPLALPDFPSIFALIYVNFTQFEYKYMIYLAYHTNLTNYRVFLPPLCPLKRVFASTVLRIVSYILYYVNLLPFLSG